MPKNYSLTKNKNKRNGPDACMMHFEKLGWCFPMSQSSLNWVDKAMESNWHRGTWVLVHRKKEGKRKKLNCNNACELLNAQCSECEVPILRAFHKNVNCVVNKKCT